MHPCRIKCLEFVGEVHPVERSATVQRDWYLVAEQPSPALHPGGCAALRVVLVTVPCVSRRADSGWIQSPPPSN
jgi:hypothetical protein